MKKKTKRLFSLLLVLTLLFGMISLNSGFSAYAEETEGPAAEATEETGANAATEEPAPEAEEPASEEDEGVVEVEETLPDEEPAENRISSEEGNAEPVEEQPEEEAEEVFVTTLTAADVRLEPDGLSPIFITTEEGAELRYRRLGMRHDRRPDRLYLY